jgi:hypothetical protein
VKRALFAVALLACGASTPSTRVEGPPPLAANEEWHGDGCRTLATRAPIHVDKLAVTGRLVPGRRHCYLDLERPLCMQWADSPDRIEVGSLQLGSACDGMYGDAEFRGTLDGRLIPIEHHGLAIDADPALVKRVRLGVSIADVADKPTSVDDLRTALLRCMSSVMRGGASTVTLRFRVVADGSVTYVQSESLETPTGVEECFIHEARDTKFSAGEARNVSIPITITRSLDPLRP